jgi:hypothetical protein
MSSRNVLGLPGATPRLIDFSLMVRLGPLPSSPLVDVAIDMAQSEIARRIRQIDRVVDWLRLPDIGSEDEVPARGASRLVELALEALGAMRRTLSVAATLIRSVNRAGGCLQTHVGDLRLDLRVEPRDSQAPPTSVIEVGDQRKLVMSSL